MHWAAPVKPVLSVCFFFRMPSLIDTDDLMIHWYGKAIEKANGNKLKRKLPFRNTWASNMATVSLKHSHRGTQALPQRACT